MDASRPECAFTDADAVAAAAELTGLPEEELACYGRLRLALQLIVIDGKLDRTIRRKANREHAIPHLLVDRFRFDSFESEKIGRVLHDTYARYVDTLLMYFVVTPPEETVERGWQRALERGRYKAVEDFLGHSVEAYSGMPRILFKWLAHARPEYRFFFLGNRVPKGTYPKTIAYGTQGAMTILDPDALLDIERSTRIDVHADHPAAVYPPDARTDPASPRRHAGFLRDCLRRIERVSFVDPERGEVWAEAVGGVLRVVDPGAQEDPGRRALVAALTPDATHHAAGRTLAPIGVQ